MWVKPLNCPRFQAMIADSLVCCSSVLAPHSGHFASHMVRWSGSLIWCPCESYKALSIDAGRPQYGQGLMWSWRSVIVTRPPSTPRTERSLAVGVLATVLTGVRAIETNPNRKKTAVYGSDQKPHRTNRKPKWFGSVLGSNFQIQWTNHTKSIYSIYVKLFFWVAHIHQKLQLVQQLLKNKIKLSHL